MDESLALLDELVVPRAKLQKPWLRGRKQPAGLRVSQLAMQRHVNKYCCMYMYRQTKAVSSKLIKLGQTYKKANVKMNSSSHNALQGCVASLRSSMHLLDSSISILDTGVSDYPRLTKVLQTTRVNTTPSSNTQFDQNR